MVFLARPPLARYVRWLAIAASLLGECAPVATAQAPGSLATQIKPIVIPGASLSALSGVNGGALRLYRWEGGALVPIPHQVDEMILRVLPEVGAVVPEHRELTFDFDRTEDGALDDNDELVVDPRDVGSERAPDWAWRGDDGLRYEIRVIDPRTSDTGYAYVFVAPDEPLSTIDRVTGAAGAAGDFTGETYRAHFEDKWLLTALAVLPSGGGTGVDLIDRLKVRQPALTGGETEDVFNATSSFYGVIDGPLRAAREVEGAASGLHTTHADVFYPLCIERRMNLRVHPVPNIWFYFDMDPAVLPALYSDSANRELLLDGTPHAHVVVSPPRWMLADTPAGSLLSFIEELTPLPEATPDSEARTYHLDDDAFNDYSGDIAGAHGNWGVQLHSVADTNISPYLSRHTWVPLAAGIGPDTDWPVRLGNPPDVTLLRQSRGAGPDLDGDGVLDASDNCADVPNANQADADGDSRGDACDSCPADVANDSDSDGVCAPTDNCDGVANPDQADVDGDQAGDACDACPLDSPDDLDGDGACTSVDNCKTVPNPSQLDGDGDGEGDACDLCPLEAVNDADGDGSCADADNCPLDANVSQLDSDGDDAGDACDPCPLDSLDDADADGSCADSDNCPLVANATQADADVDGAGDACDACPLDALDDVDADGACADADNCPLLANATQVDSDSDRAGDACDACPLDALDDVDADGVCADADNCPLIPNATQADSDSDRAGDACDACPLDALDDADADDVCADSDNCPLIANATQADADSDRTGDACDACPLDALDDADADGACADGDNCPLVANATQADADSDRAGDACDACPLDALDDADADGACADSDNCPLIANDTQLDADDDGAGDACDDVTVAIDVLLRVTRDGEDVVLTWTGGLAPYEVSRSETPRSLEVLQSGVPAPEHRDIGTARDGRLLFYSVR